MYLVESPSPPALFSWGRRCRRRMRGRFTTYVIRAPSSALGPASVNHAYFVKRPPHPPSAPSPPARNRGGRRALDEGSGKALEGTIQAPHSLEEPFSGDELPRRCIGARARGRDTRRSVRL